MKISEMDMQVKIYNDILCIESSWEVLKGKLNPYFGMKRIFCRY